MFLNTHHKDHVLCSHSIEAVKSEVTVVYTRGTNLPIPNMAYYINDHDIQRSGRGRGRPTYFKVGNVLNKIRRYVPQIFTANVG